MFFSVINAMCETRKLVSSFAGLLNVNHWLNSVLHGRFFLVEGLHRFRWKISVAFDHSPGNGDRLRWTTGHLQASRIL